MSLESDCRKQDRWEIKHPMRAAPVANGLAGLEYVFDVTHQSSGTGADDAVSSLNSSRVSSARVSISR